MTRFSLREWISILLLHLLLALFATLPRPTESNLVSPKVRGIFEFHVADLQLPSQGSANLSSCCLPGTWIPPDLCSSQCRLLVETSLLPVIGTSNTTLTPIAVFRTGVIFTKRKLYNSTLDFRIDLYEKIKGSLYLQTALFHQTPLEDVIMLVPLQPLIIKERPRKVWTTQVLQSASDLAPPIRLTLSYRFVCPPDYYGDACERYCVSWDSPLGHYKCDPRDGQIACLPGWRGDQCTEAICKDGCLHGTCDSPGVCKCREGWDGEACNQCIPSPGCNHGNCKLNWTLGHHEPFTCECQTGWSGMLCTIDTQFCSNHPETCLNDGICHNTPTETSPGYACQCQLGYEGYHCEYSNHDCRVHRCNGHGICQINGKCACFDEFYGSNCQLNQTECQQNPCQGDNSICVISEPTSATNLQSSSQTGVNFRCECQPGLSGMNCEHEIRQCDERPCQHGGKCVELTQDSSGYQCVCLPGYRGRHCELSDSACQHLPCANGGQCVDRAHHVECRCAPGWTGPTCRQNVNECTTPICKNGAACRDRPGTYECLCTPGWTGHDCSFPIHSTTLASPSFPTHPPAPLSSPIPPSPPSPASFCISACGDEDTEIIWLHTFIIIRCAVVTSIIVFVSLIILASLLLFLRRRKIWLYKKSGFEELPRPPRSSPVYWNSKRIPESLLICTSDGKVTKHSTFFGETQKTPMSGKEGVCAQKPLIYDSGISPSMLAPRHLVPLCGPSISHHAIVYAHSTPPPPYENLQSKTASGRRGSIQS